MAEVSLVKFPSDECHRTLLMISQHWFKQRNGAAKQQAIPYLSTCWPRAMSPEDVTIPQRINSPVATFTCWWAGWRYTQGRYLDWEYLIYKISFQYYAIKCFFMLSIHWFGQWLVTKKPQIIVQTNNDPVLRHINASPSPRELNRLLIDVLNKLCGNIHVWPNQHLFA